MAKRITRKLTERVKAKIKKEHAKLRLSDFGDEALRYLKRTRGAAKARAKKAQTVAKVGDLIVPKDSEMYTIIQKAAKVKGMSVKAFMKKNKKAIADLMKEGDIILQRETEYLIADIKHLKKGKKVFVNDGNGYRHVGKNSDILAIQLFTQHVFSNSDIFLIVYRVHYKLDGDLTHYLPPPEEYEDAEGEELETVIDAYYPEITYLKSAKRNEKKDKPKRIKPYSKERKKQSHPKQRTERKANRKVSKK